MFILLASLLWTSPVPLEMPRATAFLVREHRHCWLEDRFNKFDLWVSQSVDGRWMDDEGRIFLLAHLDVLPPLGEAADALATRVDYAKTRTRIKKKDIASVRTALSALVPFEVPEKATRPRQLPRGLKDLDYWQGTNTSTIVAAYLPEKEEVWRLAIWQLAEGDDFDASLKLFEKELFPSPANPRSAPALSPPPASPSPASLLRADVRHAVAAYPSWHVTDTPEFSIVDNLPSDSTFVSSLTNDLPVMRRRYAEVVPTPIDTTNTLAVARIFSTREEYLTALEVDDLTNMTWSAAYWSQSRRELVAHFDATDRKLLETVRHEAFHQYLSYAASMIPVSPWLNEGYAQYFEEGAEGPKNFDSSGLLACASLIPSVLMMDYDEFYAGSDVERRLKYRLALSIAYFLEKGAPLVRFKPFQDVKKDYFKQLFETKDMRQATSAAFKDEDLLKKFVAAWTKFWEEH